MGKTDSTKTKRLGRPPRIIESVCDRILQDWVKPHKPGERLPTESFLTTSYGVSRRTIRSALDLLEKKGSIIRKIKKGAFVAGDVSLRWTPFVGKQLGLAFAKPLHALGDSHLGPITEAFIKRMHGMGMSLLLSTREWRWWGPGSPTDYFNLPTLKGIFLLEAPPQFVLASLKKLDKPLVAVDFDATAEGIASVTFDDDQAGEFLARRLLILGHRRIVGIFEGRKKIEREKDESWTRRETSFLRTLKKEKIPCPYELEIHARDGRQDIKGLLNNILSLPREKRPTAIYTPIPSFLNQIESVAKRYGLEIPLDLTVVSCMSNDSSPSVTGMRFNSTALGSMAMDIMVRLIQDQGKGHRRAVLGKVKGRYVAGQTHGKAP